MNQLNPVSSSSNTVEEQKQSAFGNRNAQLRLWIIAVVGLAADLGSKAWVFSSVDVNRVQTVIPGFLEFRRSLNPGAVFGIGAGQAGIFIFASLLALIFVLVMFANSSPRQRVLHIALGMILGGALGNLYDRAFMIADVLEVRHFGGGDHQIIGVIDGESHDGLVHVGAWPDGDHSRTFQNDRIVAQHKQGVVRDFIRIVPRFPPQVPWLGNKTIWPWIFNVADSLLVGGVTILMLSFWFGNKTQRKFKDERSTSSDAQNTASTPSPTQNSG